MALITNEDHNFDKSVFVRMSNPCPMDDSWGEQTANVLVFFQTIAATSLATCDDQARLAELGSQQIAGLSEGECRSALRHVLGASVTMGAGR